MVHNNQATESFLQIFKKNDLSKQERQELEQLRAEKKAQENQQQRTAKFIDLNKKGEVYIGKGKDDISDSYKIGFTHDGSSRQSQQSNSHMRGFEHFYSKSCIDAPLVEKLIHNVLKRNGYHQQKEWFNADYEYLKDVTEVLGVTLNTLLSSRNKATKEDIMQKIWEEVYGEHRELPMIVSDSADSMEVDDENVEIQNDPIYNFFEDNFQISNDVKTFLTKEDFRKFVRNVLHKSINKKGKDETVKKFKNWLSQNKCLNEGQKKIDGKTTDVYFGISIIQSF